MNELLRKDAPRSSITGPVKVETHLRLHHRPNRKTVDLQDPVPNVDGVPHLWTKKHPSYSRNTQVEQKVVRTRCVYICNNQNLPPGSLTP